MDTLAHHAQVITAALTWLLLAGAALAAAVIALAIRAWLDTRQNRRPAPKAKRSPK